MFRLNQFYGTQKTVGFSSITDNVSDDQTSMSEIVKRFFHNEPIPEDMQEKSFEYGSQDTILEDGNTFDPLTREVLSPDGSVIRVDLSAPDILSTIPITPNLDMIEPCLGVNECDMDIGVMYQDATERARAMVRGYQLEKQAQADAKLKASIDLAKSKGLITEEKTVVNAPQNPSNASNTVQ